MRKLFFGIRFFAAALAVTLLAGCGSAGSVAMRATIAGGRQITVPLGKGGIEQAQQDGVRIELAVCTLNDAKKLVYAFEFSDERGRALKRVHVEDVSDETAVVMVDDAQPALDKKRWHGTSRPYEPGDPALAWLVTVNNSLRVFRFTITFADGKELTLLQGAMYPDFMKERIRRAWGEKY